MPSSLIVGALVLAWLVVLVPMIARRRQEVTRTTESALAARVVRSGSARRGFEEDRAMADSAELEESEYYEDPCDRSEVEDEYELADHEGARPESDGYYDDYDEYEDEEHSGSRTYAEYAEEADYLEYEDWEYEEDEQLTDELPIPEEEQPYQRRESAPRPRPYRPGRGGFNPEAAEIAKQAKYAFRRRVVLAMLISAVATLVGAAIALPMLWWAHAAVDLALVSYLVYLRRQVRIEEEVRQRRLARIRGVREAERRYYERAEQAAAEPGPAPAPRSVHTPPPVLPGTAVVDVDDDDPAFDELDEPDVLPYRRAVGE